MQTGHRKMVRGEGKDQLNGMSGNGVVCRAVTREAVKKNARNIVLSFAELSCFNYTNNNRVHSLDSFMRRVCNSNSGMLTELRLCVFKVWKMDRTSSRMA